MLGSSLYSSEYWKITLHILYRTITRASSETVYSQAYSCQIHFSRAHFYSRMQLRNKRMDCFKDHPRSIQIALRSDINIVSVSRASVSLRVKFVMSIASKRQYSRDSQTNFESFARYRYGMRKLKKRADASDPIDTLLCEQSNIMHRDKSWYGYRYRCQRITWVTCTQYHTSRKGVAEFDQIRWNIFVPLVWSIQKR